MRRTSWFRSVAALLALWFPLVVGEPSLLQPCPTHGAAGVAQHHGSPMAAHSGHSTTNHHDQAPTQQHQCTCIGCCAGSPSTALAPLSVALGLDVVTYARSVQSATADVLPRPGPDYSYPFKTGPPRA